MQMAPFPDSFARYLVSFTLRKIFTVLEVRR